MFVLNWFYGLCLSITLQGIKTIDETIIPISRGIMEIDRITEIVIRIMVIDVTITRTEGIMGTDRTMKIGRVMGIEEAGVDAGGRNVDGDSVVGTVGWIETQITIQIVLLVVVSLLQNF